jgi:LSD1 subclass zinc finger protein
MSPSLQCRHCGAAIEVDARLRAAMRTYLGDVAAAVRKELNARFTGAFYLLNEKASKSVIFGAVGLAISMTAALMAWILTGAFNQDLALPYFGVVVAAFTASLAAFARGWDIMFSVPSLEALAAVRVAHCSGCGALSQFPAGEPAVRCRSCNSSLLVPSELAESLLAESRDRARLSGDREAEAFSAATSSGDRLIPAALVLIFASVAAGMGVVLAFGNPRGPAVSRGSFLLVLGVIFTVGIAVMTRSTARASRARRALEDRIGALAGRVAERAGRE